MLRPIMNVADVDAAAYVRLVDDLSAGWLAYQVRQSGRDWVWVEGFSDAGQSDLSEKLAAALGWRCVSLDDLIGDDPPAVASYTGQIHRRKLSRRTWPRGAA